MGEPGEPAPDEVIHLAGQLEPVVRFVSSTATCVAVQQRGLVHYCSFGTCWPFRRLPQRPCCRRPRNRTSESRTAGGRTIKTTWKGSGTVRLQRRSTLIVAVITIAGCGSTAGERPSPAGKTDEQQIRELDAAGIAAVRSHDGAAFCRLMTAKGRAGLLIGAAFLGETPKSCADAATALSKEPEVAKELDQKLGKITIAGDFATAGTGDDANHYRKISGRWYFAADDEGPKPAPVKAADTCTPKGITPAAQGEGNCTKDGVEVAAANLGTTARLDTIDVVLHGTKHKHAVGETSSKDGQFVIAQVTVTNTGTDPIEPYEVGFSLSLAGGTYKRSSDLDTEYEFAKDQSTDSIGPGLSRDLQVGFEVPNGRVASLTIDGNLRVTQPDDDASEPTERVAVLRTYA